ncbi:exodeoxyribonuclease V subunit alpha [Chiayiivirga flava]|uniref:RecBCD enzyme subunit RecD n=1 Tax=Chiayiivirga flava TaxID=659595 RepID=A0A7W8D768_9GAMM|nr:exodeoxyribonuclease V subunit alpha [Chiayiivirga flava]MBB5207961.1 exodeoxyribonuclease V alpha subunit [Chiayiivirga flava]
MTLLDALLRSAAVRAVDHAFALALRRIDPATPDAVLAAAALAAAAVAQGHSVLPLACAHLLLPDAPNDTPPPLPPLAEWLDALRASRFVASSADAASETRVLVLEDDRLALRRYWRYERRLAAALCMLGDAAAPSPADHTAWLEPRLAQLFPLLRSDPGDAQAIAARAALVHRVLLLTGGPGTGKTTTVARLLVLAVEAAARRGEPAPRILLAAPTGKAAARLGESLRTTLDALLDDGLIDAATSAAIPSAASTVHRLLGTIPNRSVFRHDAAQPLAADLVVVDEASMVDLPLMTKLVEAVSRHARLMLIGDPDQLPSVETGNVLSALCDAADRTPEFAAFPGRRVHLHRSHRQAAQLDLAPLAAAIREGEADVALDGLAAARYRGVEWQQSTLRALPAWLRQHAVPHYRALQLAADPQQALDLARRYRVLTALRAGPSGSLALNAQLVAMLDPSRRGDALFHGGLAMVVQNSYRHGLFNGDIGVGWRDAHDDRLHVWFDTDTGLRPFAPTALPAHEPAFALTVHKSQGSEFDRVLLVLPEHDTRAVSRELLYTGLTRTREHVTVWAGEDILRAGIARRAQRYSGLARCFGGILPGLQESTAGAFAPPW